MPRTVRRVVLFVAGLLLILLGLALIVLPGPLTIPPILLGVWLWSLEFEFARHWLRPIKARARTPGTPPRRSRCTPRWSPCSAWSARRS